MCSGALIGQIMTLEFFRLTAEQIGFTVTLTYFGGSLDVVNVYEFGKVQEGEYMEKEEVEDYLS